MICFIYERLPNNMVNYRVFSICVACYVKLCRNIMWDYVRCYFLRVNALSVSFFRFFFPWSINVDNMLIGIPI